MADKKDIDSVERDLGQELLEGIRAIKAGKIGRKFTAESYSVLRAREKSGLS